jgi:hypothetical protein
MMENCEFIGKRDCTNISSKVDVRYFWGNMLALGNATSISKSCVCINTMFCFPLNSRIELLIPFKRKVLEILARVSTYKHADSLYDTMRVEVLNPSQEYSDFVDNVSLTI